MKNIPETIYLQVGDDPGDDFSKLHLVTWCADRIEETDIPYQRPGSIAHHRDLINVCKRLLDAHRSMDRSELKKALIGIELLINNLTQ